MKSMNRNITKILLTLAFVGQFYITSVSEAETAIEQCDKLTANPYDPERKAPSVPFKDMKKDDALLACWHALAISPKEARLQYQYGLASHKDGSGSAIDWFLKAAKQEYAAAAFQIAAMYKYGNGVNKNTKKALIWYKKAAKLGLLPATNQVGYMYQKGIGINKNYKEAVKWYKKAAEGGYVDAQYNMAVVNKKGLGGVEINKAEAAKWYEKAAEQGNIDAQYYLADMYYTGDGINKNFAKAFKWFKKAAEKKDKDAIAMIKKRFRYMGSYSSVRAWVDDNDSVLTPNVRKMDFVQRYAVGIKKSMLSNYTCNLFKEKIDMMANSNYPDNTRKLQVDIIVDAAARAGCVIR